MHAVTTTHPLSDWTWLCMHGNCGTLTCSAVLARSLHTRLNAVARVPCSLTATAAEGRKGRVRELVGVLPCVRVTYVMLTVAQVHECRLPPLQYDLVQTFGTSPQCVCHHHTDTGTHADTTQQGIREKRLTKLTPQCACWEALTWRFTTSN